MYNKIMELAHAAGFKNATELCRTAGVPRTTLSELKMGRHTTISRENGERFCRVLGCSLDEFYGYEVTQALPTSAVDRAMFLAGQLSDEELIALIAKASDILNKRKK